MTILFLDFDGVLHPWDARAEGVELFAYLPRFEAVLRDFPEARVVVCSDWRKLEPWETIFALFAPDIQPRVIGATPALPNPHLRGGSRHMEAMHYLEQNQLSLDDWIALDDVSDNWPANNPGVIICTDGFFDREEELLRAALHRAAR